jgi:hypothetical protein
MRKTRNTPQSRRIGWLIRTPNSIIGFQKLGLLAGSLAVMAGHREQLLSAQRTWLDTCRRGVFGATCVVAVSSDLFLLGSCFR